MKCTPLFAVQVADAPMSFAGELTQGRDQQHLDVDQVQAVMQQVHEHLEVEIRGSQALQEEGANTGPIPEPKIQVGSKVALDARIIRTICPTSKLNWKRP